MVRPRHVKHNIWDITPVTYTSIGEPAIPKLTSLTLSRLDLLHGVAGDLYDLLDGRCDQDVGLERLVVESCRVHTIDDVAQFEELVEELDWTDPEEMGSDYEGSENSGLDQLSEYERGLYNDFYDFY